MATMTLSAALAQMALSDHLVRKLKDANIVTGSDDTLPARSFTSPNEVKGLTGPLVPTDEKICIVGAGACGLYLALMLRYLGFSNFDVLESSQRVGGRCYTHKFTDDPQCPHNYYDIGAMRIPKIDAMKSTLNLIDYLELQDKKVPYVLHDQDNLNEPNMYWYKPLTLKQIDEKTDRFSKVIERFITDLETNFDVAFQNLMKTDDITKAIPDEYSTKAWLMQFEKWDYKQIEMAETFDTSTGLFNQGFVETLCDYYDFDAAAKSPWYRLEGGIAILTDTMEKKVASTEYPEPRSQGVHVSTNRKVFAMRNTLDDTISVTSDDGNTEKTDEYTAVFNTTAMGCLQQMDLSGLELQEDILQGIRTLAYDRASKVAIKFSRNWWRDLVALPNALPDKKFGGVSQSDLPISNIVYPSWDDGADAPTVLMVSYAWAQDATRISSLIPPYKPDGPVTPSKSDPLVTLTLQNIAKLFSNVPDAPTYAQLQDMYVEHHAFTWSHHSNTTGAFALFGPGQFRNVYPLFQQGQCNNKFWICGEAISAHHAWISGALDSAYTALSSWLLSIGATPALEKLKKSPFGDGKGLNVKELNETMTYWKVKLGQKDEDLSKA